MNRTPLIAIALLFSLTVCLFLMAGQVQASTVLASGECGTSLSWALDDTGTLTISGSGAMKNYGNNYKYPWYSHQSRIKAVVIEEGVTSIENYAFSSYSALTSVLLPDSLESINAHAFSYCDALTELTIPAGVKQITTSALLWCDNFSKYYVDPDNAVFTADEHGVLYNKSMTAVFRAPTLLSGEYTIPEGVTQIGRFAFADCQRVDSIFLPDSLIAIYDNGLYSMSISSIRIPAGVQHIGSQMFIHCNNLKTLIVDPDNNYFSSDKNKVLYNKDQTHLIFATRTITGSYLIPDTVTEIEPSAFSSCTYLTSVTIPETLTYITNSVFFNCSSLKEVVFPSTLTRIGRRTFSFCTALTDIYYAGTAEQWQAVSIAAENEPLLSAKLHTVQSGMFPKDQFVKQGSYGIFSVSFPGEDLTYRWQYQLTPNGPWFNTSSYTKGYNTNTLSVIAEPKRDGFRYRCRVTDASGKKNYSAPATLDVDIPQVSAFASQPAKRCVMEGNKAVFSTSLQGDIISIQWQYQTKPGTAWYNSSSATQGYNTDTLTVVGTAARNGFLYRCVVTDAQGYVHTSLEVPLQITAAQFTADPQATSVPEGENAVFTAQTAGEVASIRWQYSTNGGNAWYNSSSSFPGYNTLSMTVNATAGRNGFLYRCVITDSAGNEITSAPAKLTVTEPIPELIVSHPENCVAAVGQTVRFHVQTLDQDLSYQWQYSKNGGVSWYSSSSATQGYNTDTLTVEATAARNGFLYRCAVTDPDGNKYYSQAAKLTVMTAVIVTNPADLSVSAGSKACFQVAVAGNVASYQ